MTTSAELSLERTHNLICISLFQPRSLLANNIIVTIEIDS